MTLTGVIIYKNDVRIKVRSIICGTVLTTTNIPKEKLSTGDKVTLFLTDGGKLASIEPLVCQHDVKNQNLESSQDSPQDTMDYSDLDSHE